MAIRGLACESTTVRASPECSSIVSFHDGYWIFSVSACWIQVDLLPPEHACWHKWRDISELFPSPRFFFLLIFLPVYAATRNAWQKRSNRCPRLSNLAFSRRGFHVAPQPSWGIFLSPPQPLSLATRCRDLQCFLAGATRDASRLSLIFKTRIFRVVRLAAVL